MILIVQPRKQWYNMTVVESPIMANLALLTALLIKDVHLVMVTFSAIVPLLGLAIYISYRLLRNPCSNLF